MASIAKQPVIYAMVIAVLLLITDTELPRWISNTLDLLGGIAIPLMTIALGVSLATLRIHFWKRSLLFSLSRVGGGLLFGFIVCELMGLTGISRNVVLLQSAMPVAVFNYLLALRYNRHPEEIAAMVQRIQSSTREAVTSMEAGVTQVDKGMTVTADVERAIREILEATLSTTRLVDDISRTIGEQSLASHEIAQQVENIANMSRDNSQVIEQTAQTTDELARLADELGHSVDRFRLN